MDALEVVFNHHQKNDDDDAGSDKEGGV